MKSLVVGLICIIFVANSAMAEPPQGKGGNKSEAVGPIQVLANGTSIGTFLWWQWGSYVTYMSVLSSTGYGFQIASNVESNSGHNAVPGGLDLQEAVYEMPDCIGPMYVQARAMGGVMNAPFSVEQGYVLSVVNQGSNYYVPAGSQRLIKKILSIGQQQGCYNTTPWSQNVVEIVPNDPVITGVPNERQFPLPITLGQ